MDRALDDDETARWVAWKRATQAVLDGVAAEIADAAGLSVADFSVLTRLVEDGGGSLRQQHLSDELGWERSRLSRQLSRMEMRGLVGRAGTSAERLVTATPEGRRLVGRARAAHAAAVRRHLTDAVPHDAAEQFWTVVAQLSATSRTTSSSATRPRS